MEVKKTVSGSKERGPRIQTGEVVSDKMDKTIVVEVVRTYMHPLLKKVMRSTKNYKVHDPDETASVGDTVEFFEGRPMSKQKYMYLGRIIKSRSV